MDALRTPYGDMFVWSAEMAAPSAFGVLNRPNGKWRELGVRIRFELELETTMVENVMRLVHAEFYTAYHAAVAAEEQRVRKRLQELKISGRGKRPSARPTDKALSVIPYPSLHDMPHLVASVVHDGKRTSV